MLTGGNGFISAGLPGANTSIPLPPQVLLQWKHMYTPPCNNTLTAKILLHPRTRIPLSSYITLFHVSPDNRRKHKLILCSPMTPLPLTTIQNHPTPNP